MNENQQNQPVQDPGEVLLIDKPLTWTSFDVVKKLKYAGNFKKIGHAGTLDPLATGLLILCTGKMTKQIDSFQAQEKEYSGTLVLGKTTPSIDLETEFDGEYPTEHITEEIMQNALVQLTFNVANSTDLFCDFCWRKTFVRIGKKRKNGRRYRNQIERGRNQEI
jgi:tRNA pseudouridine55 synthase